MSNMKSWVPIFHGIDFGFESAKRVWNVNNGRHTPMVQTRGQPTQPEWKLCWHQYTKDRFAPRETCGMSNCHVQTTVDANSWTLEVIPTGEYPTTTAPIAHTILPKQICIHTNYDDLTLAWQSSPQQHCTNNLIPIHIEHIYLYTHLFDQSIMIDPLVSGHNKRWRNQNSPRKRADHKPDWHAIGQKHF